MGAHIVGPFEGMDEIGGTVGNQFVKECLEVMSVGQWILTAGGILLGIPMTLWMSHMLAVSMSAKMYSIPDFVDAASVLEAIVLMGVAVFISSQLILKKLKAVSPVSLLMERE